MSDMIMMGLALAALLGAFPLLILHDTRRHRGRQYQKLERVPPNTGTTARGVPYVRGRRWHG